MTDTTTPEPTEPEQAPEEPTEGAAERPDMVPPEQAHGPEYVAALEQYRDLVEDNQRRRERLARGNPPMGLEPMGEMASRLETVIEMLLPTGSEHRLLFEMRHQEKVASSLGEAEAAQRKASLSMAAGAASGQQGLIVPGQ